MVLATREVPQKLIFKVDPNETLIRVGVCTPRATFLRLFFFTSSFSFPIYTLLVPTSFVCFSVPISLFDFGLFHHTTFFLLIPLWSFADKYTHTHTPMQQSIEKREWFKISRDFPRSETAHIPYRIHCVKVSCRKGVVVFFSSFFYHRYHILPTPQENE